MISDASHLDSMPQEKTTGHVRCKVCGSTRLREKYGKMECEQCGARYTFEQMKRTVAPVSTSKPRPTMIEQTTHKKGSSKKLIAIGLVAAIIVCGVIVYLLSR